jgi:hypothetical protein
MTLDEMMNRFRLASRELFNHYFRLPDTGEASGTQPDAPSEEGGGAWDLEMRFSHVERMLFDKMVCAGKTNPRGVWRSSARNRSKTE